MSQSGAPSFTLLDASQEPLLRQECWEHGRNTYTLNAVSVVSGAPLQERGQQALAWFAWHAALRPAARTGMPTHWPKIWPKYPLRTLAPLNAPHFDEGRWSQADWLCPEAYVLGVAPAHGLSNAQWLREVLDSLAVKDQTQVGAVFERSQPAERLEVSLEVLAAIAIERLAQDNPSYVRSLLRPRAIWMQQVRPQALRWWAHAANMEGLAVLLSQVAQAEWVAEPDTLAVLRARVANARTAGGRPVPSEEAIVGCELALGHVEKIAHRAHLATELPHPPSERARLRL